MPIRVLLLTMILIPVADSAAAFPIPAIDTLPEGLPCPRAESAPVIDGHLVDGAWARAPWTPDFVDITGDAGLVPRLRTRAKLLWDDDYLYVGAELAEPHVWASLTTRDAVIYHDNDFEVFIDPDGDNHLYCELEINALNTVWDLLLVRPYRDGGPAVDAWDITGLRTAVHVDGTLNDPTDRDRGWSVEIALPWDVLAEPAGRPTPPAVGDIWRINFSRVQWRTRIEGEHYVKITDDATGRPLPEDNWVWSPQGLVAMHCPERWGKVVFVTDAGADPFVGNAEHDAILVAGALMPLYYRQREFREEHGRFAADLAELGLAQGELPLREPGRVARLAANWRLELTGDREGFRARLSTPQVIVTVDGDGRLQRFSP